MLYVCSVANRGYFMKYKDLILFHWFYNFRYGGERAGYVL